jgi:DNA-binding Lrp family transcriptional regulator
MRSSRGIEVQATKIGAVQAKILKELLIDGRKSTADIAKKIGVETQTVNRHFREMKRAGIIAGATIHINYRGFGYKAVAALLMEADPEQTDNVIEYVGKMRDIYSVYQQGPKGNIRIVATLRTLQQLDEVKDAIKRRFPNSHMKTAIWTDVREMHRNLALTNEVKTEISKNKSGTIRRQDPNGEGTTVDDTDLRIADKLSQDGRMPAARIAKDVGLSSKAVNERIANLERNGKLKVTIQINPVAIGYRAIAVFYTSMTPQADSMFVVDVISAVPDVISIMKTSGDYDLQIFAMIRDIDSLLKIQETISGIRGVAKMDMEISGFFGKWPTPRQYMSTF